MSLERRYTTSDFEIRANEAGKTVIRGYGLKFGVEYDMGWFTEEIGREALNNADLSDVRILLNHDPNIILGRTKAGTAKVTIDETGLYYEAELPDSPNGQNVRVALERGDISQSSWGFMLKYEKDEMPDEWTRKNGKDHRVIKRVYQVFDASPVTFPANPDTTAAKRSKEQFEKVQTNINAKLAEIDCILASYQ